MKFTIAKNNSKKFETAVSKFTTQLEENNTEVKTTLVKESSDTQTWNVNFETTTDEVEYLGVVYYINDLPIAIPTTDVNIAEFAPNNLDVCDVCGTRRVRNSYHIFNVNGKIIKAGSKCADKYLNNNSSSIDTFVSSVKGLEDDDDRINLVKQYSLESVISACYYASKGFTIKYNKETTPDLVLSLLNKEVEILDNVQEIKDEIFTYWFRMYGDFANNVRNTFKHSITSKNIKIAMCGVLFAMVKDLENSNGSIGDKITCDLTLIKFDVFKNDFGETYSFNCNDSEGNIIIVRTSDGTKLAQSLVTFGKDKPGRFVKENFKITGTIKSIKSYGTILTRCKEVK